MSGITILGSAFAVANANQENTHLLIRSGKKIILVDCGNNPAGKLEKAGADLNIITDLVLTHAHADHMGALPLLVMDMWLRRREVPLVIHGLAYTLERARMLLGIFDWSSWANMFPVEFQVVAEQGVTHLIKDEFLVLDAVAVKHSIPTIGIRADFSDLKKTIAYSSDTSPCTGLDELAAGADVLIQEAAGPGTIHTSPEQAGETASRAGVKRLVLIHYDSARKPDELIAEARMHFGGDVELAYDLMEIS